METPGWLKRMLKSIGIYKNKESSGKLFRIEGEEKNFSSFSVHSITRPKRCPLCLSTNCVTRFEGKWKCEECDYTWS
jgi:hypothetical protein